MRSTFKVLFYVKKRQPHVPPGGRKINQDGRLWDGKPCLSQRINLAVAGGKPPLPRMADGISAAKLKDAYLGIGVKPC